MCVCIFSLIFIFKVVHEIVAKFMDAIVLHGLFCLIYYHAKLSIIFLTANCFCLFNLGSILFSVETTKVFKTFVVCAIFGSHLLMRGIVQYYFKNAKRARTC